MSSENQNKTKLKKISQSTYKPILNPRIFEDNFRDQVRTAFTNGNVKNGEPVNHNNAVCSSQPFPYCIINDFLCLTSNSTTDTEPANSFLLELKEQLLKLNFNPKSNDLYQFAQTSELIGKPGINGANESSLLRHVVSLLHHKLLPWLRDTTTIELNDDVDMFCAQYKETDYLLCHDDELENRRIAYVYYLSPDWSINDGGALQLFNSNQREYNGSAIFDPGSVIHEIVPKFNSMVLFEVCPTSYHQVAEIITSTKTRLSLTGWFHGPTEPRPARPPDPRPIMNHYTPSDHNTDLLVQWVNPAYLSIGTQAAIREQFGEDSEIQLNDFLLPEKYDAVCDAARLLRNRKELWGVRGPPSKQFYHKLKISMAEELVHEDTTVTSAMAIVHSAVQLFHSEEMFLFLSNISGLSFHPMTEDSDSDEETETKRRKVSQPKPGTCSACRSEFRRWEKGCYTLLRDNDYERGEFAIDVNLFINAQGWSEENGGYIAYVADNENEELLTIVPAKNNLSVAYRDNEALRFVKYVNSRAPHEIYDISMSYIQ